MISDAEGLDTRAALDERRAVLDYIQGNYELIQGSISKEKDMGNTVVRKK